MSANIANFGCLTNLKFRKKVLYLRKVESDFDTSIKLGICLANKEIDPSICVRSSSRCGFDNERKKEENIDKSFKYSKNCYEYSKL